MEEDAALGFRHMVIMAIDSIFYKARKLGSINVVTLVKTFVICKKV